MAYIDQLTPRTESCTAILLDKGDGKPSVPACMGAAAIDGATVTVVGCPDIEKCSKSLNKIDTGMVEIPFTGDDGVVTHTVRAPSRPLRKNV